MKKLFVICFCSTGISLVSFAASLDIDCTYRLRGLSYRNADYNVESYDTSSYYENKLQLSIAGSPAENIRLVSRIQSLGLAGGSTQYTLVGGTTTARYPETNSQPWIEQAYIQLDNINNLPLILTIGRQPFLYGKGFIFSDDDLGFTGLRGTWKFSEYLSIDAFTVKISEARFQAADTDAYGLVTFSKKIRSEWLLGLFLEQDKSGTPVFNNPTTKIEKYLCEYYFSKDLNGAFYSVDIGIQRGTVDYLDPLLPSQQYRGSKRFAVDKLFDYLKPLGYIFEGGLKSPGSTFTGPMQVHIAWGVGTGDDGGSVVEQEAFTPSCGKRYDGLERIGFGKYYAATLYDAYPSLPSGYSGLQIIKFGGTISPFATIKLGIDYFIFDAQQAPAGGAKQLGRELDFTCRYPFSTYITLTGSYALFFPKDGSRINGSRAERLEIGITGRF